jgi:hypothetical protein
MVIFGTSQFENYNTDQSTDHYPMLSLNSKEQKIDDMSMMVMMSYLLWL